MPLNILSRGKGRIEIDVTNKAYHPGEAVEVGVHLTTRKDLGPGRLFGSLVCTERIEEIEHDADGDIDTDTHEHEVYRHEVDLAVDASFPAGTDERMSFTVQVPAPPAEDTASRGDDLLGAVLDFATSLGSSRELVWKVECRYDIPRLDLADSERISVNTS